MKRKRLVLVTGASGAIGSTLTRIFEKEGFRVRALIHRNGCSSSKTVEQIQGSLEDHLSLRQATEDVDVVLHLAAKLHINNPDPALGVEYFRTNVEGTRNLADAAKKSGVKRFIYFSSINVYGPTPQCKVWDESSSLHPDSIYAETKLEGERIAMDSLPCTVLRLAAVYGPVMKGNYSRLLKAVRKGYGFTLGDGMNRRTLVHVEDVCRAALTVVEDKRCVGQIYNVTDGLIHTLKDILVAMGRALGKTTVPVSLPLWPVRSAAVLVEEGYRLLGRRSPIGKATIDKMVEDMAVSGEKLQRETTYRPHFGLEDGWRHVITSRSNN